MSKYCTKYLTLIYNKGAFYVFRMIKTILSKFPLFILVNQ